jgi:repressor LexA
MKPLTARQTELLEFIRDNLNTQGLPPTIAEIAAAMGIHSPNGVRDHLRALARKGVIELFPNRSRGIRLIQEERRPPSLPIVGRVAAGSPILAAPHIEGHCQLGTTLFRPSADYLLRVQGMSMRDAGILEGDLLAVHRTPQAGDGRIVVARIEDEVTVKRLRLNGHRAYLEPANPDYAPIEIDLRSIQLCIEGLGVGVIRNRNL